MALTTTMSTFRLPQSQLCTETKRVSIHRSDNTQIRPTEPSAHRFPESGTDVTPTSWPVNVSCTNNVIYSKFKGASNINFYAPVCLSLCFRERSLSCYHQYD